MKEPKVSMVRNYCGGSNGNEGQNKHGWRCNLCGEIFGYRVAARNCGHWNKGQV